jgi:hypothetical protein
MCTASNMQQLDVERAGAEEDGVHEEEARS